METSQCSDPRTNRPAYATGISLRPTNHVTLKPRHTYRCASAETQGALRPEATDRAAPPRRTRHSVPKKTHIAPLTHSRHSTPGHKHIALCTTVPPLCVSRNRSPRVVVTSPLPLSETYRCAEGYTYRSAPRRAHTQPLCTTRLSLCAPQTTSLLRSDTHNAPQVPKHTALRAWQQ